MNLELQILQSDNIKEFKDLIVIFENVFEMKNFNLPSELHLQKLLNQETFYVVTARANNKVIGGLTVYVLDQYYSDKPLAYIYDLAVLTNYQRKGVGRKLIAFTNQYFKERDLKKFLCKQMKLTIMLLISTVLQIRQKKRKCDISITN